MYNFALLMLAAVYTTSFAQITNSSVATFFVPQNDPAPATRQQQLDQNKAGFQYGPPLLGNTSFTLTGPLGDALVAAEDAAFNQEIAIFEVLIELEAEELGATLAASNRSQPASVDAVDGASGFFELYADQFRSSNPDGIDPGATTNFTQDLYFSMERLSVNPYTLTRIHPNATLPFTVADNITTKLTGVTLAALQQAGRLFLIDHSNLTSLPIEPDSGKFAAACQAYFYLHPKTDDFLPLAIKTNTGADLTYSPLDPPNDWFLAKTLLNANDAVYADFFHLSATHQTANIVNSASLRTMASDHPVRGYLDQIMMRAYAVISVGASLFFGPGGPIDAIYPYTAANLLDFNGDLYHETSGHFQALYFDRRFFDQGLVNTIFGPELPHFPYFEDASLLVGALRAFTNSFVNAYYPNDAAVANDPELQAWIVEANGPAEILDFPPAPMTLRSTLVDILTQMTHLTGVLHHLLNGVGPAASEFLPMYPVAHYQPLPTSKGIKSVAPFLPNTTTAITTVSFRLGSERPGYRYEGFNLGALFSNPDFLTAANNATQLAVTELQAVLANITVAIESKTFDSDGLSQGMPFIWRTLSPLRLPFFLDV